MPRIINRGTPFSDAFEASKKSRKLKKKKESKVSRFGFISDPRPLPGAAFIRKIGEGLSKFGEGVSKFTSPEFQFGQPLPLLQDKILKPTQAEPDVMLQPFKESLPIAPVAPVAEQIAGAAPEAPLPQVTPSAAFDIGRPELETTDVSAFGLGPLDIPEALSEVDFTKETPLKPAVGREAGKGIFAGTPRPDIGYVLSALGASLAPEGSTAQQFGQAGVKIAQQKAFSKYMTDVLAGREPNEAELNILTPEQRLEVVQVKNREDDRRFEKKKEQVDLEKKMFDLEQKRAELNLAGKITGAQIISREKIEQFRGETQFAIEAERAKARFQQGALTEIEAVRQAALNARAEFAESFGATGSLRELYIKWVNFITNTTPSEKDIAAFLAIEEGRTGPPTKAESAFDAFEAKRKAEGKD